MTNPNQDTDPSTPGAKRQSDPRTPGALPVESARGSRPPRSRPNTDPGIAPPGPMLPVPEHPMGIVVPPPGSARALNDSVDVLLEGISRELPDRPRATSQSDGHSAARYHVEHAVRASDRSPSREEPKVVIERAAAGQTARVARYAGPVDEGDPREWSDDTTITTHSVASRVVVALAAGVIVVVAIFVALQRTSNDRVPLLRGAPAPASPATALFAAAPAAQPAPVMAIVAVAPVAPPAPTEARIPVVIASASAAPPAPAPTEVLPILTAVTPESLPSAAASNDASHRQAAAPPHASHPKAKPAAPGSKPAGTDLSEFKTNF
jgi:hypothetical protein